MYFSERLSSGPSGRMVFAACLMFSLGCTDTRDSDSFVRYSDTAPGVSAAENATQTESQFAVEPAADQANPSFESASLELATQTSADAAENRVLPDENGSVSDSGNAAAASAGLEPVLPSEATKPLKLSPPASDEAVVEGTGQKSTEAARTVVEAVGVAATAAETPGAASTDVESAPREPREIQLLIPDQSFRREKNSTAVRVSYDDIDLLKILNMEPVPVDAVKHFPDWLKALDGTAVRIRGFMYPTFEATGLTAFTLARDNGICCFVRQPKIYDIISIELASGVTSDYIEGKPFDVEGVFRIQPEADETELYRLYRIENARVLR